MRRIPPFAFVIICAAVTSHNAAAQSSPVNWTGFYGGANFGYSSDGFDFGDTSESFATNGFRETMPGGSTHGDSSFLAGGQIGYNQQFGKLVLGLEGDIDWVSFESSIHRDLLFFDNSFPFGDAVLHANHSAKLDLTSTLRARVGMGWRSLFFYATGGLALGDLTVRATDISSVPGRGQQGGSGSDSGLGIGWAAGGGVEWSITPAVSIAAEYQHLDFGSSYNPTSNEQLFDARGRVDFADDQVAMRVNVHLNGFFGH